MEGGTGANEGKKRRLPSWMMGGAVANNLTGQENKDDSAGGSKPGGVGPKVSVPKVKTGSRKAVKKKLCEDEETCVTVEVSAPKRKTRSRKIMNESLDENDEIHESEEINVTNMKRRPKRRQNRTLHEDEEANTDNSCVLVKCATGKRNRTSNSEVEESMVNNIGNEILDRISAPRKNNGLEKKMGPKDVLSSGTNSRRELVMEDLISIAEEYVKAESLTEQRKQEVGATGPEEKCLAADPSSDEPASSSFDSAGIKCLSAATEVESNLPSYSDQVHNGSTFNNISNTGDAAQDMLNLLLGPLLMKPVEESTTSLARDDMLFVRPVQHQSQNHIVEESVPQVKKKASLKDKVAMFLD